MPPTKVSGKWNMACGCIEGTHGKTLSEIAPWHRGANPWELKDAIDKLDRLRARQQSKERPD
jgi:hypothetical protein